MEVNRNKHIWEGWTVGDFIDEIEPTFNLINMSRNSDSSLAFKSTKELKEWVKGQQPYYKKHIPEVYNYFLNKTNFYDGTVQYY